MGDAISARAKAKDWSDERIDESVGCRVHRRGAAGRLAPFAIGMTVTVCILMFGVLAGGSVNPARTIGPAVATVVHDGIAICLVAQLVGGTIAGVLYRVFWATRAESAQLKTGPVLAE